MQGEINEKYPDTYYKEGNDDNGIPYRYQSLEDYIGQSGVGGGMKHLIPLGHKITTFQSQVETKRPHILFYSHVITKMVFSITVDLTGQQPNSA